MSLTVAFRAVLLLSLAACRGLPASPAQACKFSLNEAGEQVAQCDADLADQGDVNALDGVVEISGHLRFIAVRPITDLSPLSALRRVGGSFGVSSAYLNAPPPRLQSLARLDALDAVEGNFSLSDTRLTDVGPFPSLTRIGGSLNVDDNARLTNLDGLGAVTEIGGDLDIQENGALTSVRGLGGVTQLGGVDWSPCDGGELGNLNVIRNPALASLDGLQGVRTARKVAVVGEAFTHVDGLSGLTVAERLDLFTPMVPDAEQDSVRAALALCNPGAADTDE